MNQHVLVQKLLSVNSIQDIVVDQYEQDISGSGSQFTEIT